MARSKLMIIVLLLYLSLMTVCILNVQREQETLTEVGVETQEIQSAAVSTLKPPPPTFTFIPSTVTTTPTPTELPSVTLTLEPASLIIDQDVICRTGPGTIYDVETYLSAGIQTEIKGSTEQRDWWLIARESDLDQPCWISSFFSSVKGASSLVPVLTPPPFPTLSPTPTLNVPGILYYLVAENTGGPVGCGDSLIAIYPGIRRTGDLETNIKAALTALFANHTKYVNGLLNPIYESRMKAKSVSMDASTGVATVQLAGTFVKPKDACESMRMHAQVWFTINQFNAIKHSNVWLGNVKLGDLMEK